MLSDYLPIPTVPTADLDKARAFYEGVLGFGAGATEVPGEGVIYKCGNGGFLLYRSQFAGTNKATAMAFQVDGGAFDAQVADLRSAGVTFDTFDLPGASWDDGVAAMDGGKAAWFHDPDGNIISLEAGNG